MEVVRSRHRYIFRDTRVPHAHPALFGQVSELRARELATPTVVNRLSYVRGFLAWAKGRGFIHFDAHSNPTSGQASYGAREKHGFRAYNDSQLKLLFAPANLKRLNIDAQLGMWMGLLTGKRVSEVAQLALSDFFDVDGIPFLRITNAFRTFVIESGINDRGFGPLYLDHQPCNIRAFFTIASQLMVEFKVSKMAVRLRLVQLGLLIDGRKRQSSMMSLGNVMRRAPTL